MNIYRTNNATGKDDTLDPAYFAHIAEINESSEDQIEELIRRCNRIEAVNREQQAEIDALILQYKEIKELTKNWCPVYVKTTAEWNENPSLLSETNAIYVYSDRQVNGKTIPGIKVGNGAYLIDIVFTDVDYAEHIINTTIHVTQEDKDFWNDKLNIDESQAQSEIIIFNRN